MEQQDSRIPVQPAPVLWSGVLCFLLAVLFVYALLHDSAVAAAQTVVPAEPAPPVLTAADSARLVARVRSAQARFERLRRNHFPWTSDSWGGECDERVGRFCLRHDDDDDDWEPPPEPDAVQQGRARLISDLDAAAALLPGDEWIVGQRVRYLVEASRYPDAQTAAAECRVADRGWCAALAGFVHHTTGDWERADSAFAAALRFFPPREHRRWTDLSPVIGDGGWRSYRRASDAERDSLERRFWWLADPLYMVPGNDRRTEHFSRLVMDRLQDRAKSADGVSWGSDLRELLLRYGWPVGWERVRPRTPGLGDISIVSHYPPKGRHYLPSAEHVENPYAIPPDGWPLDVKRAHAEYTPAYASTVELLEHQVAVFPRGDSVVVVGAYTLGETTVAADARVEAALILARDELSAPVITRSAGVGAGGVLHMTAAATPMLLSLEALVPDGDRAARIRYGIRPSALPPDVPGLSDLLLLNDSDGLPGSLSEALPWVRGTTTVRSAERVVLYWELTGVGADTELLDISMVLTEARRGWVRRLAERTGIVRQERPIRLRWQEAPPDERGTISRSVAVELPDLPRGAYILELSVAIQGREPITASRTITVTG
jgi:hypothetical protein